jgi:hypothetical protein
MFGARFSGNFQPSLRDWAFYSAFGPSDQSLGYCQLSLRDKEVAAMKFQTGNGRGKNFAEKTTFCS